MAVPKALLTASQPELLDRDGDTLLRSLLYDFFAFGRNLEAARAKFASSVDLSPTQYLILITIARSSRDKPPGINQLAERLHLSGAFVTIEVNKLVAEGLLEKTTHPSDGRRVQLGVTDSALALLAQLASFQRPVNDALFGTLTRDEFRVLAGLLARLAENGERALKVAEAFEATMELAHHRTAQAAAPARERRQKPVGRLKYR